MRARHNWCHDRHDWSGTCNRNVRLWPQIQKGVAAGPSGQINVEPRLDAYDSVSDLPFWIVKRASYHNVTTATGGAAFFACTVRPVDDWIRSVIDHGSAGGTEMHDFMGVTLNSTLHRTRPFTSCASK